VPAVESGAPIESGEPLHLADEHTSPVDQLLDVCIEGSEPVVSLLSECR
jgi:hypothetical protein